MRFDHIIILTLLAFSISCNGQESTTTTDASGYFKTGPDIIRKPTTTAANPGFDTTLVSQYIRSIFQDSKGNLWFGTIDNGVVRYDTKTLTYFSNPDGFVNKTVYAITEDKNGNLWLGTDQGVYKYDGKTFRNYNEKDGLTHIDISRKGILVDRSGNIWVGTHGGVYRYDPAAEKKGRPSFSLFPQLNGTNIAGIMEDREGNIWFASSNKGAFRYDGQSIKNFNDKEGLSENYAGGMAQDPKGNMWFTMKTGICKFDGKTFTEYTAKDGLSGTEFWGILIEKSGIIWITARGSTTRFDPSIPLPNPADLKVFTSADGFTCCVQSMFQDKSGKVWFGTGQGLYRFNGAQFLPVRQTGPW